MRFMYVCHSLFAATAAAEWKKSLRAQSSRSLSMCAAVCAVHVRQNTAAHEPHHVAIPVRQIQLPHTHKSQNSQHPWNAMNFMLG